MRQILERFFCAHRVAPGQEQDLAQESVMRYLAREAAVQPAKHRSFLFGIAYRVLKEHQRERQRHGYDACALEELERAYSADLRAEIQQAEKRTSIYKVLESLPDKCRHVIMLVDIGGRTHAEAAALMGCTRQAVSKTRARALERLRNRLEAIP